jgi:hypothetical protein
LRAPEEAKVSLDMKVGSRTEYVIGPLRIPPAAVSIGQIVEGSLSSRVRRAGRRGRNLPFLAVPVRE